MRETMKTCSVNCNVIRAWFEALEKFQVKILKIRVEDYIKIEKKVFSVSNREYCPYWINVTYYQTL